MTFKEYAGFQFTTLTDDVYRWNVQSGGNLKFFIVWKRVDFIAILGIWLNAMIFFWRIKVLDHFF